MSASIAGRGDGADRAGGDAWLPAAAVLVTVGLGVVLRWALAGRGMPAGDFALVRSAHSHLAYYGVLFPFVWRAWRRQGEPVPGRPWMMAYAAATAAATVDFALRGYALVSIVGSTVVLMVWIASAWPLRGRLLRADWLAPVFPAVVGSSVAIPVVAVLTRRGDPWAMAWVHAFLAWLLLGVAARTALRRTGAPAPPGWLQTAAVLGAGLALGPFPIPPLRGLLLLEGLLLAMAGWRGWDGGDLRVAWMLAGAGLAGVAVGWIPWSATLAVAAIHFLALGPILSGLAWPSAWRAWRSSYLALVGLFNGLVVLTGFDARADWAWWAALAGTGVAGIWVGVIVCSALGQGRINDGPPP